MPKSKDTTSKSLKDTLTDIDNHFGKGTVMRMGDRENLDIPSISTGSLGLDIALGIGGIPKGRVTEIYGPESSGKTTLTLQIIAQCQKEGGTCAFIDAEHALDPQYAEKLGVNVDEIFNICKAEYAHFKNCIDLKEVRTMGKLIFTAELEMIEMFLMKNGSYC